MAFENGVVIPSELERIQFPVFRIDYTMYIVETQIDKCVIAIKPMFTLSLPLCDNLKALEKIRTDIRITLDNSDSSYCKNSEVVIDSDSLASQIGNVFNEEILQESIIKSLKALLDCRTNEIGAKIYIQDSSSPKTSEPLKKTAP